MALPHSDLLHSAPVITGVFIDLSNFAVKLQFAFLASNGVQVIAETHCEHLVNRVRYEVYKKNMSAGSCVIHYKPDDKTSFSRLGINGRGHFVDPEGHETAFPAGFFDSTLSELLEMS